MKKVLALMIGCALSGTLVAKNHHPRPLVGDSPVGTNALKAELDRRDIILENLVLRIETELKALAEKVQGSNPHTIGSDYKSTCSDHK